MPPLVITPGDDQTTKTAARWGADAAHVLGASLLRSKARGAIDDAVAMATHVFYFGHGERDALVAKVGWLRRWRRLVDHANLPGSGRIVVAVACLSAKELGPDLARNGGVEAYIGWAGKMSWPPDAPDPICLAITSGIRELADGGTVGDGASTMSNGFSSAHDQYEAGLSSEPFAPMQASYWIERLRVEGNSYATL
jgi:hypothetical protein